MSQPDDDKTRTHVPLIGGVMVSHYRIIEKIGAGGMGDVYLAEDTELNRRVALKFLPPQLCQDADCRARFKREAQAAAKLDHPNIVSVFEVGESQGRPFFSMQHVEGQSLKEILTGKSPPLDRILEIGIQICDGLQAAHENGITHRDIKPSNILIDSHGRARIVDFGLASVMGSDHLTKTGSTMGTLHYMSPEQTRGEELDYRSDIFSLGVVLYEMITGQLPFKGDHEPAVIYSIGYEEPEPLTRYKSGVPDELQRIVGKMLAKDKSLRYQHADELVVDLKRVSQQSEFHVLTGQPSIAVLPFTNLSPDPEQEYFCDGMAEEIITALTQIEDLRVIARTSAFAFKGKHEDIRDIGRKLDVTVLLEGSVRKAGSRLRITAQLINVEDGSHLWSERFDRELEDIFAVQEEIAQAIVEKMKFKLARKPEESLIRKRTENLEAYSLFLKGRYYWYQLTPEGWKLSLDCFRQAIAIDPEYAMPYTWIAIWYQSQAFWADISPNEAYTRSTEAMEKALRLDPNIAELYNVRAVWRFAYEWNWEAAEHDFEKALELGATTALSHTNFSTFLVTRRRFDEATRHMEIARKLDPLSSLICTWAALPPLNAGDYDRAIDLLDAAVKLDPTSWQPYFNLGMAYMGLSRTDHAIAVLQKSFDYSGGASIVLMALSICYYQAAMMDKADEYLDMLHERAKYVHVAPMFFAWISIARGDVDQGVSWIEKAKLEHDPWICYADLPVTVLKSQDPRINAIRRSIGLPVTGTEHE
ncbi:MAG: protein kinase [candidate division Zixibacteria bacterium]|nr:protein kinase [candidate division Zixibacteria bacterium]